MGLPRNTYGGTIMGFFENQKPLLVDLDRQIFGTLIEMPQHRDDDFVLPVFIPIGSLKKVTYTTPVAASAVYPIFSKTDGKGVEKEVVYICEGNNDSVAQFISKKDRAELERLKSKVQSMRVHQAITAQERDESVKGTASFIRNVKEASRSSKEKENENNPIGTRLQDW